MPSLFSLIVFSFSALFIPVTACCTAWKAGERPIRIAAQEVLIVWDEENQMEHFVRRASFKAEKAPKDFGFLVPTPSQPKLHEVPDLVFSQLGDAIKPKVQIEKSTEYSFMPLAFSIFSSDETTKDSALATRSKGQSVEVLDRAFVGGFEAAVLRASETGELIKWLEENGYNARPELQDWVTPYVEKEWIITAFKYASEPEAAASSLSRASVCLSFKTDAPFFPYRVPSDIRVKPQNGSLLRLYFAGQERVTGEFKAGPQPTWKAKVPFSSDEENLKNILEEVVKNSPETTTPNSAWLTAFEDNTWPGGAEDLYFVPSPKKEAIVPDSIIKAEVSTMRIPLDIVLIVLFIAGYFYKKRARKA